MSSGESFRIGEPMHTTNWDIHQFVLMDHAHLFSNVNLCRPFDNNPMLGAMKMFLKGQSSCRIYHNSFDLEAIAKINTLIIAPWPIDASMFSSFFIVLRP